MSTPKNKKAPNSWVRRRSNEVTLSLTTTRKMLPLIKQIASDIKNGWDRLTKLEAEQVDLDQRRRQLSWPDRSRRYRIAEDISRQQNHLQEAVAELEQLQVVMVDPVLGEVTFPTVMNGRKAYFIWRTGADDIGWWCYANDPTRQALGTSWRRE